MPVYRQRLAAVGAGGLAAALFMVAAQAHAGTEGTCSDLLPNLPTDAPGASRSLQLDDLVRLRDVGPVGAARIQVPILSVSPDMKTLAFQIRRADPKANRYCLGIATIPLSGNAPARLVDTGGDLVLATTSGVGFGPREAGFAEVITPKWSPDGAWLAYLRRDNGVTQVWRAAADGHKSESVTRSDSDVTAFIWSADGRRILFQTVAEASSARARRSSEERTGYLFDDRFDPALSNRPLVRTPIETYTFSVDVDTGKVLPASADEQAMFEGSTAEAVKGALLSALAPSGAKAWVARDPAAILSAPTKLFVQVGEKLSQCVECENVSDLWWSIDGSRLYFLRRERDRPKLGIYQWQVGAAGPRRILITDEALVGCVLATEHLICADEASDRPRRLVSISLLDGRTSELFDLNPEFRSIKLGAVRPLKWTNAFGLETIGHLVLPPDYRHGSPLPLIVVGYQTEGFLRGGVGDDYPIQLYASRGYAVLSYERPPIYGVTRGAKTVMEAEQINHVDWADYRSVVSSLEIEVKALVDEGLVDANRVGLTGFSNGASVAQYAMVNSKIFKAYAVSHCCEDPVGVVTITGPAGDRWLEDMGYPKLTDTSSGFWKAMSLRLNATRVRAPILMQLPDDEYLGALEGFGALREQGKPVELYVFPNEHHVKWQPAHRAAEYQRSLDWFDFWLRGVEDGDPAKADQYKRWRTLRDAAQK